MIDKLFKKIIDDDFKKFTYILEIIKNQEGCV